MVLKTNKYHATTLKWFLLFIALSNLCACSKFDPEQLKAWDLIDKSALIIDVRSKQEFDYDHLENAFNIEYENIPQLMKLIGNNKSRSVVLYCRSGRRASVALSELKKLGYNNIFNGHALRKMQNAQKFIQEKNEK